MTSVSPLADSPASIKHESPTQPTAAPVLPAVQQTKPPAKSKPRKRVNTAEKRHQHNAIERARRETLNSRFLRLAELVPPLASHRRPSKSAIVNGSISHLTYSREQRLVAAKLIRDISAERDQLLKEVNHWRKISGLAPRELAFPWNEDMEEICSVENEIFGSFASYGEEDGDVDEDGEGNYDLNDLSARSSGVFDHTAQNLSASFADSNNGSQVPPPTAGVNGVSWSHEFAFNLNSANNGNSHGMSSGVPSTNTTGTLPYSAFMSDNISSSDSGSNFGSAMLTPPGTSDGLRSNSLVLAPAQTFTPSPRSSNVGLDDKFNMPRQHSVPFTAPVQPQTQPHQWTEEQILFLQQMRQQTAVQSQAQAHAQAQGIRQQSLPTPAFNSSGPFQNPFGDARTNSDNFTQSLLATVFTQQPLPSPFLPEMTTPGGGMVAEHVQQMRKSTMAHYLQAQVQAHAQAQAQAAQQHQQQQHGLGISPPAGLNMPNGPGMGWIHGGIAMQNQSVEGF